MDCVGSFMSYSICRNLLLTWQRKPSCDSFPAQLLSGFHSAANGGRPILGVKRNQAKCLTIYLDFSKCFEMFEMFLDFQHFW